MSGRRPVLGHQRVTLALEFYAGKGRPCISQGGISVSQCSCGWSKATQPRRHPLGTRQNGASGLPWFSDRPLPGGLGLPSASGGHPCPLERRTTQIWTLCHNAGLDQRHPRRDRPWTHPAELCAHQHLGLTSGHSDLTVQPRSQAALFVFCFLVKACPCDSNVALCLSAKASGEKRPWRIS